MAEDEAGGDEYHEGDDLDIDFSPKCFASSSVLVWRACK